MPKASNQAENSEKTVNKSDRDGNRNIFMEKSVENDPTSVDRDPITFVLEDAGIVSLEVNSSMIAVENSLRLLTGLMTGVDHLRRLTIREAAVKKLEAIGIKASARLVDAAMPKAELTESDHRGKALFFADPVPWEREVDGSILLNEIMAMILRYVVLGQDSAHAVALWVLHCWTLEAFDISPLLAITSPEKRCGKTTLLEIVGYLAPRAVSTANITAAALFRLVEKFLPTVLVDEADTFLRDNDELRGVLNSGHRRSSAFVVRTIGDDHEPAQFKTWAPKAVALIGKLPSTLEDRSIPIAMRRRALGEMVARYRLSECELVATPLRRKAFRWAGDHLTELRASDPATPAELNDRAADNWRPLLSIADLAASDWPERARGAALTLSKVTDEADGSALVDLLTELDQIFQDRDRIPSEELVAYLGGKSESRWAEWSYGKPITQRQLARLLARLNIKPNTIRSGAKTAKGYLAEWFVDAFSRYLPLSICNTVTSEQSQSLRTDLDPSQNGGVTDRKDGLIQQPVSDVTLVTDRTQKPVGIDQSQQQQSDWEDVL